MKTGHRYYEKNYNLPTKISFCSRCVNSNQRPRITFNKEGICSACQWAFEKNAKIDWKKREKELIQLCDNSEVDKVTLM